MPRQSTKAALDERGKMDEVAFWGDDELEDTTRLVRLQQKEECAHCHKKSAKRYCDFCKEKFPNTPTKALKKRVMEEKATDKVTVIEEKKSEQGFYSDSGSDSIIPKLSGTKFSNLPWASSYHSSDTPSTGSDYDLTLETTRLQLSSWVDRSWTDEGDDLCVLCGRVADTCVMHFSNRHTCFCLECATSSMRLGPCPLCHLPILYIYKYENI